MASERSGGDLLVRYGPGGVGSVSTSKCRSVTDAHKCSNKKSSPYIHLGITESAVTSRSDDLVACVMANPRMWAISNEHEGSGIYGLRSKGSRGVYSTSNKHDWSANLGTRGLALSS